MYDEKERIHANRFLKNALDIGANLLMSGAEIHRVEDSMRRICYAYGAEDVNVFSITYTIIVTISSERFGILTQTRRIESFQYNLHALELLNDLSRTICKEPLPLSEAERRVKEIMEGPKRTNAEIVLAYALISSAFTMFFGGEFLDALAAACIGLVIRLVEYPLKKCNVNSFFVACICSAAAGFAAIICVKLGFGYSVDKISIGNIMIVIPGLMFTNSVRDMFADNMISGFVRFCEAIFLSVAIAFGFALAGFQF